MSKIIKFLKHPIKTLQGRSTRHFILKNSYLDDELYLKKFFKKVFHYELNLENPKTYNEKLQWLKLYDRKPLYTQLVDKVLVRDYVKEKIGDDFLIPLIGIWERPEDIDFDALPTKFVLKCNHNSGLGMCICKNKNELNKQETIKGLQAGLNEDFYLRGREWPYKNVKRKIIGETYLEDKSGVELMDYKLFCFDGHFKVLLICSDRHTKLSNDWYDENLNHLPCVNGPKNRKSPIIMSSKIHEMIKIAEILTAGIPQARVDFYDLNGKIYFGEITLFESSGLSPFKPKQYDLIFGSYINLPDRVRK